TLMRESETLPCALVDIDAGADLADVLAREVGASDGETQVAWRNGERHVARLVRAPLSSAAGAPLRSLRIDGSVFIIGGLGALGLEVATEFARRGVPHLVLAGRRGRETPGAAEVCAQLERMGTRVTVAALDVADREALARTLDAIPREMPLRGIV